MPSFIFTILAATSKSVTGQSLAAAGYFPGQTAATATRGALYPTIATTPVTPDRGFVTNGISKTLSYTLSASSAVARAASAAGPAGRLSPSAADAAAVASA